MNPGVRMGGLLQEALGMAAMVSLRDDLSVQFGEWWAFNWVRNEITIPIEELQTSPEERIAWIILHEAAHAGLTRIQDIVSPDLMQRREIHVLLNCIEDIRIEEWLLDRFPGARPWRDVCRRIEAQEKPTGLTRDRIQAFCMGLFEVAEELCRPGASPGLSDAMPEVREALERIREPLRQAIACRPPFVADWGGMAGPLYQKHPVSVCYRDRDDQSEPTPFEKWARMMQAACWFHSVRGILPVYLELLRLEPLQGGPLMGSAEVLKSLAGSSPGDAETARRALRSELARLSAAPYQRAVESNAGVIAQMSRVLDDLLPNHRGLRHQRGYRAGDRIDLGKAFQAEADPQEQERMWIRRQRRTLPDPAFVLVMDRSESMRQYGRSVAAFESLVVVREACTRAGIPFSVVAFNSAAQVIQGWDRVDESAARAALGLVLKPAFGTDLKQALEKAALLIAERRERDRFVVVLTDGMVNRVQQAGIRAAKAGMEAEGVRFHAIGIGADAAQIGTLFPGAPVLMESASLPAVLGQLLLQNFGAPAGR